ncbi:hypothetical protein Srot_0328 [Segniliparus rotundus DSM 44985]|uniref:Uncharacterized protein n=1 Tax=Segniliparus rotundus (strain ATCC BAA-972 / CDC 1076 / CIP 108378 / DSM 44985 / JCM 13578) TaxID=640132 RepID=D6ZB56_SEGRD|nr:hypothetical protein [Segniliparus rotundus]ADG96815.1 hypothetical protein Srot_0328 [Segniliparus rotundus DSM 44985]
MQTKNPIGSPRRQGGRERSLFAAARAFGAVLVCAQAAVSSLPPQAGPALAVAAGRAAAPMPSDARRDAMPGLALLAAAQAKHARPTEERPADEHRTGARGAQENSAEAGRRAPRAQARPASGTTTLSLREPADSEENDDALPSDLSRGAGYDQVTELALQDPATAEALHTMARFERDPANSAAVGPDNGDPDNDDPDSGGEPPANPALAGVLSLNNGPILYQPPCPFGWPPPDRYGGLADIIELAPMAGDFVSEAFAPAAAWQPMAQLFGPLIAIIQPTIKPNKYWIDPTIINVQNPINAIHYLFFGWYDVWHRQKFLQEEVEWANEVAPWLQQVYQTPQAACWVAFLGMFERLVETGNPWPRGWYVEDHATTWDVDKIGPYEPASPGSRPRVLEQLDHQLAIEDGDAPPERAPAPAAPAPAAPAPSAPQQPRAQEPPRNVPSGPQEQTPPPEPFPSIEAGEHIR